MLTRLKVKGFKNLLDVDVRFGPMTCVAGGNGVGKSNLFDAIQFLSALANSSLMDAALSVRSEEGRSADIRNLFHRVKAHHDPQMSFEVEMIIPSSGYDDLRQEAKATITFLRYQLVLQYRPEMSCPVPGTLEILHEELSHIRLGDAPKHLRFPHAVKWRESVLKGRRSAPYFISTDQEGERRIIRLHQDTKQEDSPGRGRPLTLLATHLPRTALSTTNAAENPTASLARQEMQSWRLLQLEPSALRRPDPFTAPARLGADGSHLASTLYRLAHATGSEEQEKRVYAQVANRLSELIDDVRQIDIEKDERRELLTLMATDRHGTIHPAQSLSDGTLRFLALSVLEQDPEAQGTLCLEEPENGIHPGRIPAMLRLLTDIAVDVNEPIGPDNPLRQMIINTHSPSVVKQTADDSLLVAELQKVRHESNRTQQVCFSALPDTWRTHLLSDEEPPLVVAKGKLLAYLNPDPITPYQEDDVPPQHNGHHAGHRKIRGSRRVMDRPDFQILLPFGEEVS